MNEVITLAMMPRSRVSWSTTPTPSNESRFSATKSSSAGDCMPSVCSMSSIVSE